MNVGDEITVFMPVWAEYTIKVKLTSEMVDEDGEVSIDAALDEAYENLPGSLCHGCTTGNTGVGWGAESPVYLELGESPEASYATDDNGNVIWGDTNAKLDR